MVGNLQKKGQHMRVKQR